MHTRLPLHRKRPQSKTFTAREALRAARGEAGKGSMKYKTWKGSLKSIKLGRTSMKYKRLLYNTKLGRGPNYCIKVRRKR